MSDLMTTFIMTGLVACIWLSGYFAGKVSYARKVAWLLESHIWSPDELSPIFGRCRSDETDTITYTGVDSVGHQESGTIHVMECSYCGHTYEHVNGDYEFCPRCGKRKAYQ